ncbi:hypothetical protein NERG_02561 [Nematocida ausubeli]|uniref:Uncharacterized protein n=1 Tax=Nematocida ausubeli (strain ATCC PRA-371 / ERTm2) TaxID=1913371 RepID=H8ZG40_NEMA1|nr:hypothetical protein NERG_02561 [Nematocida ausubeli]
MLVREEYFTKRIDRHTADNKNIKIYLHNLTNYAYYARGIFIIFKGKYIWQEKNNQTKSMQAVNENRFCTLFFNK